MTSLGNPYSISTSTSSNDFTYKFYEAQRMHMYGDYKITKYKREPGEDVPSMFKLLSKKEAPQTVFHFDPKRIDL